MRGRVAFEWRSDVSRWGRESRLVIAWPNAPPKLTRNTTAGGCQETGEGLSSSRFAISSPIVRDSYHGGASE